MSAGETGMQMMLNSLFRAMNLDPVQVKETISQTANLVVKCGAQLDRIEANQRLICKHLGIDPAEPIEINGKVIDHGETRN